MTVSLVAGRYRVVRELGRGGMGVVYLVEHAHTGDHLALKLLLGSGAQNAATVERFKREARASARIKSEHVVRVVDADVAPELDGAPFLVMELLDGSDLEKRIEQQGSIPAPLVVDYLSQAARALDKAHGLGIVHRDLKPENLFLHRREDGSSIVKIVDFGISKFTDAGDVSEGVAAARLTSTGAVMGTPLYMAPEQARGRVAEIGPATDVWAMGLIALHLLTGEIYWRADTIAELMVQILSDPMYPPSERWPWLPPAFDRWFARSCAREPAARFAHMSEQIEALGAALSGAPEAAFAPTQLAAAAAPRGLGGVPGAATTTRATTRDALGASSAGRSTTPRLGVVLAATAAIGLVVLAGGGVAFYAATRSAPHAASALATAGEPPASRAVEPEPAPPPTTTAAPGDAGLASGEARDDAAPAMPKGAPLLAPRRAGNGQPAPPAVPPAAGAPTKPYVPTGL